MKSGFTDQIDSFGFFEFENKELLPKDFKKLYKQFDAFINKTNEHDNLFNFLSRTEKEFSHFESLKKRYCSAPSSYRSYLLHPQKKHHKIYFQFIGEYYTF